MHPYDARNSPKIQENNMTTLGKRIRAVRGSRSQNVFANFFGYQQRCLGQL